jgi:predicted ATP-grasp superfamily ATP-dependent carboligase
LTEIVAEHEYAILLPGSEASLVAISEHRDSLEPHVRVGLPAPDVVQHALDKAVLLEAAAAAGLTAPATIVSKDAEGAPGDASTLGFPVILKPVTSFVREGDALRHRSAEVARSPEEVSELAPRFGTPLVVQRYEQRPVLSCAGVVSDAGVVALAVARYSRTWPIGAGPSSYSVTITPPVGLRDRLEVLLRTIGWRGIFQIQLLELENRFATLDFNPRIFGSLELAVAAGANLPALWAETVLGRNVDAVTARPGVHYRWEEGDAKHFVTQLRRRRLRDAISVLVPRRLTTRAYFRGKDPLPLAAAVAASLARRPWRRRA